MTSVKYSRAPVMPFARRELEATPRPSSVLSRKNFLHSSKIFHERSANLILNYASGQYDE